MNDIKFLTTGMMARELNCPLWKIQYIIASRRIEPTLRVGNMRGFDPKVVELLQAEIKLMGRKITHGIR